MLSSSLVRAEGPACGPSQSPLFSDVTPLEWELQADFETINDSEIPLHERKRASSAGTFRSELGTLPVQVSARGKMKYDDCTNRPLSISSAEKNLYGFEKLKLTLICFTSKDHAPEDSRNLLKDQVIYQMLGHLPSPMLKTRLVQLTLKKPNGRVAYEGPAYVREPESALAKRCGLREREPLVKRWDNELRASTRWLRQPDGSLVPYDYVEDPEASLRMEVINHFLNNPDYLPDEDHNVIPMVSLNRTDRRLFLIPYDFDLSQAADGSYYAFNNTAEQNASGLIAWLGKEKAPDVLKRKILAEFLNAAPEMEREIGTSPIDPVGKSKLLHWLAVHLRAIQAALQ